MNALVVGGSSGIGLSIVLNLIQREDVKNVYVMDKNLLPAEYSASYKVTEIICDLTQSNYLELLPKNQNVQMLYITAGFGHLKLFQDLSFDYIQTIFAVNVIAPLKILRYYYDNLLGEQPFYCAVMVSIAGRLCSPFFSVYSATKAALSKGIEAINVELDEQGSQNRILEVSPGSLKGTSFNGGKTEPSLTTELAAEIIKRAEKSEELFIPQYEDIYKDVLERYHTNPHQFGIDSYQYKLKRIQGE